MQSMAGGQGQDPAVVGGQSEQVRGNDRFGMESGGLADSLNLAFQVLGIHVEGDRIYVHKHRNGAGALDGGGSGNVGEVRQENRVFGADVQGHQ